MPVELTIYQVKDRLGMGIREAMRLYNDNAFPTAIPNRQARDVRIPIEDFEAYKRRINGVEEATNEAKAKDTLATMKAEDELEDYLQKRVAKVAGFETVELYKEACQLVRDTGDRQAITGNEQREVKRQQEAEGVSLGQRTDVIAQREVELDQREDAVEAREDEVEAREKAVESQEDKHSSISTENYRMSDKCKGMAQVIQNLDTLITKRRKINSWWKREEKEGRVQLDKAIGEEMARGFKIYGSFTTKDGQIQ